MLADLAGLAGATRPKSPRAGVAFGVAFGVVALALATACGGGPPVTRAFGSTELEPIRDSTIFLNGENGPGILVYNTEGGNSGSPMLWWSINLVSGAVQSYGTQIPPLPPSLLGTSNLPPYNCDENFGVSATTFTLQIVDSTTNAETDVPNVVSLANCPGADQMLTAFVVSANGGIVLETGPFTQLTTVPLPAEVLAVVSWGSAGVGQPPTTATVLATQEVAPDQAEIDTIDLTTLAMTVDVPAVPASVAWAPGATPLGSLQSTSLAGSGATILVADGHYIYPRLMSDGGTTVFAGPFASGAATELALFELPAGETLPRPDPVGDGPGGVLLPNKSLFSWQLHGGSGAASNLVVWDDTDLALVTCPSFSAALLEGVWSSDQSKVLFVEPQVTYGDYGGSGPLDLLTIGGSAGSPTCQQLASDQVETAAFSPDSDFVFWLAQPTTGQAQLWTAASDGSGARMILSGDIEDLHFIGDAGARLEMVLGGELDWLDLHDATATFHHVAEQVYGSIFDLTDGPWLVVDYQWNATDGTGTLALVNRDNGHVQPISPSVAQFEVLTEELGADGGLVDPFGDAGVSGEFLVVYLVRGRNPSAQDGIWRATITPSELQ
jgi:hypothetical protein